MKCCKKFKIFVNGMISGDYAWHMKETHGIPPEALEIMVNDSIRKAE